MPLWRNGLARWTSNSEDVGSNPIRGTISYFVGVPYIHYFAFHLSCLPPCFVKEKFSKSNFSKNWICEKKKQNKHVVPGWI